jgi:hypothetical protein
MPRKRSILPLVILAALTACSRPATSSEIEALHVLVTDASGAPLPSFPILARVWAHELEYETAKELDAPLVSDAHGLLHFEGVGEEAALRRGTRTRNRTGTGSATASRTANSTS